jgi:4-hydroxy-tetrahydrodipicolinate synthase
MARTFGGCYTALVTPLDPAGGAAVDYAALERLIDFQIGAGVRGVLAVGTTGESPTLTVDEHVEVITATVRFVGGRCTVVAGTGANCTKEAMAITRRVVRHAVDAVLLVEPYYNGPSSMEIRREYMEPVARAFPDVQVVPYVIPARTGTQLLPEDLALLHDRCPNVNAVKEASASLENMRRTREYCGDDFDILSGDDNLTFAMLTSQAIAASGVISVVSNVAPAAVQDMTEAALAGRVAEAEGLARGLQPLFDVVTVKTQEDSPYGPRLCRARNPLPIKTLMRLLGMPVGPVRRPLGRMTPAGLDRLVAAAREVIQSCPGVFDPVAAAFDVDIEARLDDPIHRQGLEYSPDEA